MTEEQNLPPNVPDASHAAFIGEQTLQSEIVRHDDEFEPYPAPRKLDHNYWHPSEEAATVLEKLASGSYKDTTYGRASTLDFDGQLTERDMLALVKDGYGGILKYIGPKNHIDELAIPGFIDAVYEVEQFARVIAGDPLDVFVEDPVLPDENHFYASTDFWGKPKPGMADEIVETAIKQSTHPIPLPNRLAHQLIRESREDFVLPYLEFFPDMPRDQRLVDEIFEAARVRQLEDDKNSDEDTPPDKYSRVRHAAEAIAYNVSELDESSRTRGLFDELMRQGAGETAISRADKFAGVVADDDYIDLINTTDNMRGALKRPVPGLKERFAQDETLFDRILDSPHPSGVYVAIDHLAGLTKERAYQIIHKCAEVRATEPESERLRELRLVQSAILYDTENFKGLTLDADLADALIENGEDILYKVEDFSGLTHVQAEKLCTLYQQSDDKFTTSYSWELFARKKTFTGYEPTSEQIIATANARPEGRGKLFQGNQYTQDVPLIRTLEVLHASVIDSYLSTYNKYEHTRHAQQVPPDTEDILKHLDRFRGLTDEQLATLSAEAGFEVREFPHANLETGKFSRNLQYAWYADHAYIDMGQGWDKTTIGQIIALRLEQVDGEYDLHDASQWLSEFKIPEEGYDVSALEALRASGITGAAALEAAKLIYIDSALEQDLLRDLLHAPADVRQRLALPTKEAKLDLLFSSDAHRLIYTALMANIRSSDMSFGDVEATVNGMLEAFYDQQIKQKRVNNKDTRSRVSFEDFKEEVRVAMSLIETEEQPTRSITKTIARLHDYGMNRKAYVHDASSWLLRHATAPSKKLTKVWRDRGLALSEGVNDSLPDILRWQEANAYRLAVERMEKENSLPKGVTAEELMGDKWSNWRHELMRVQSASNTIEAISKAKRWLAKQGEQPKVVPATNTTIELDGQTYTFEVLDARDPRGFTIGEDTACCMTIHGVSNSCIKEGYRNPNAGFMALYDPKGKLLAQSFLYVHPKTPDTVVLDNIEANQGRNFEKITRLYEMGWKKFIADHEHLPIRHVNIGVRYTSVDLDQLKEVNPVPPLSNKIYTDAERQLGLI